MLCDFSTNKIYRMEGIPKCMEIRRETYWFSTEMQTIFFNCISLFSSFAHLSFCATHLASTQIWMNSPICLPNDSACIAKHYFTRKKYDYELFNQGPGNLLQFSSELTFFLYKVGLFLESISSGLNGRPPRRYTPAIHYHTY